LFWLGDEHRYVDAAGDAAEPPRPGTRRAAAEVDVHGERVGAIVYDASLVGHPSLADAAGRVVALAVERERLTAQLLAGRAALRESRARIVAAGDQERRRIARDLHDGLQAHLVLLGLQAGRLAVGSDPVLNKQATQVRTAAELAIAELRRLVHGIMPALLQQRGLFAAVEELVERMPVPTHLERTSGDPALPEAIESAGYFTVAEGLANAVKHAGASELRVRLAHVEGRLEIEVRDDGIGGARMDAGGGLRGVADRVEALGGRCRIDSPPGAGTRLWAELPCAS
jgi:signal transduction histidine kinase